MKKEIEKIKKGKIKAIGLFSGGLDSALAIKLLREQEIEVVALNFVSPFCTCTGAGCSIVDLAKKLDVPIKLMNKGSEYLRIVRYPKHGYGKNLNPCIDCRIFILKKAKKYAKEIGAKFIFTGEVLGQRPMSQHYKTLLMIEKEAGLSGKLVRPLCAGLMPLTEAEKKGWVSREKLLKLQGRGRSNQLDLAKRYAIDGFMCGGSGCRLTDNEYANKLRKLFNAKKRVSFNDIQLLRVGRHFKQGKIRIIVGRNEQENKQVIRLKQKSDFLFEAKGCASPITLLRGKIDKEAIRLAALLTATYSDAATAKVSVKYGKDKLSKEILVDNISKEEAVKHRV